MMTHEESAARLDEYLDGTLDPAIKAEVESHLIACPVCRDELTALQSILADARALPRSVMPARDLWGGIESRLGGSAAQRTVSPSAAKGTMQTIHRQDAKAPRNVLASWRLGGNAPLLIAAAVALLIGGMVIGRLLLQPTPSATSTFAIEQGRYSEATNALARQLASNPNALTDETRAVVERNLAIVDEAIHEAEKALNTDPGNTALEQMVLARYQQRLALLKRATDAGRQES